MNILNFSHIDEAISAAADFVAGRGLTVFVTTFGCQQNEADSEKLYGMARSIGYSRAAAPEEADLLLVNTCAIREHAELKALSVIGSYKHLKAKKPSLVLGVCGCMTAQDHRVDKLKHSYPYVDFTLEPASMHLLPAVLATIFKKSGRLFLTDSEPCRTIESVPPDRSLKHRGWVSIMYGCNNFCSYCIVPYVRHRERSRHAADVEKEVRTLVEDGCRDITLLGQNVNSFAGGCDFATLLARLDQIQGDFRLRFMTSHPKDADARLVDVMADGTHIAPHLHLPLQSGSDSVLRKMNRHYDLDRYMQTVNYFRQRMPKAAITSDIIVGFPGESDADFEATMQVLSQVRYDMVYSFIYSPRKGTPAAKMPDQVPPSLQKERMGRLLALQDGIALAKNQAFVGQDVRVLVDALSREGETRVYTGRTGEGKPVLLAGADHMIGTFQTVHIDRADPYTLRGTIK